MPPPTSLPFRGQFRNAQWSVAVRSEVGHVRRRLEDAWSILPQGSLGAVPMTVLSVFDGLGGMAYGQEAAWAAADGLADTLAQVSKAEAVLPKLNAFVRPTLGATTAVVALIPQRPNGGVTSTILSAGDSSAYALDAGEARRLTPRDAEGESVVTRYLGDAEVEPHVTPWRTSVGSTLLLCTDGVDRVVQPSDLLLAMKAADLAAGVDGLISAVLAAGAPDNATVVLARRTG